MANTMFDAWMSAIDVEGLAKDAKEAEQSGGTGDYTEVPTGTYEVKVEKMELKNSSKNQPMVSVWFRILAGDHQNQLLFMNQVITQGFQIGIVNNFLRSLDAVESVEFKDYAQYNNLLMDVHEAIEKDGLEYLLQYSQSKKGFPIYTVKEVYQK